MIFLICICAKVVIFLKNKSKNEVFCNKFQEKEIQPVLLVIKLSLSLKDEQRLPRFKNLSLTLYSLRQFTSWNHKDNKKSVD